MPFHDCTELGAKSPDVPSNRSFDSSISLYDKGTSWDFLILFTFFSFVPKSGKRISMLSIRRDKGFARRQCTRRQARIYRSQESRGLISSDVRIGVACPGCTCSGLAPNLLAHLTLTSHLRLPTPLPDAGAYDATSARPLALESVIELMEKLPCPIPCTSLCGGPGVTAPLLLTTLSLRPDHRSILQQGENAHPFRHRTIKHL